MVTCPHLPQEGPRLVRPQLQHLQPEPAASRVARSVSRALALQGRTCYRGGGAALRLRVKDAAGGGGQGKEGMGAVPTVSDHPPYWSGGSPYDPASRAFDPADRAFDPVERIRPCDEL